MKRLVQALLASLAKQIVKKHKPKIIAITGSVGKSSTKEAVYAVLKYSFRINKSEGNLNNEFGVPLSILGYSAPSTIWGWPWILLKGFSKVLFGRKQFDFLVLEYGIDHPGDMVYLCKIAKPDIAIITAVETVHLVHFKDEGALAHEKEMMLTMLTDGSLGILNYDNVRTRDMVKRHPNIKIETFGLNRHAGTWVSGISVSENGTQFTAHVKSFETDVNIQIPLVGKHQIYTVLPAVICGLYLNIPSADIIERLTGVQILKGRMNILDGLNGSKILDGSYNAEPASTMAGLETLREIPSKRKVAIFGDMLELGPKSRELHVEIAKKLSNTVSLAILVGPEMQYAYNFLKNEKMNQLSVFHFANSVEAGEFVKNKVREGDLVLIKGSQGIRMEKITKVLLKDPEKAHELLVRQSGKWTRN